MAVSRNPADQSKNCETKPKLIFKCSCKQLKMLYEEKTESQIPDRLIASPLKVVWIVSKSRDCLIKYDLISSDLI
jgi:hypothetical protein